MIFLAKLTRKEKIGLSLGTAFLVIALFDRLMITPISNRVKRLDKEINVSEKKLGWFYRNINQEEIISKEYNKYIPPVKKTGSDEEEVAKILGEIESLARNTSVRLANIKPHDTMAESFYKKYAVEFEAEGTMENVMKLLFELNMSSQILRVEKLRFSTTKVGDVDIKVSALISKILIL